MNEKQTAPNTSDDKPKETPRIKTVTERQAVIPAVNADKFHLIARKTENGITTIVEGMLIPGFGVNLMTTVQADGAVGVTTQPIKDARIFHNKNTGKNTLWSGAQKHTVPGEEEIK